jgi:hypothetical protein
MSFYATFKYLLLIAPALVAMMVFEEEQYPQGSFQFESESYFPEFRDDYSSTYGEWVGRQATNIGEIVSYESKGRHTSREQRMILESEGICWISGGRAHRGGGERCTVGLMNTPRQWNLISHSGATDFECFATCVSGLPGRMGLEQTMSGTMDITLRDLGTAHNRVCFLVNSRAWFADREECEVHIHNNRWRLRGRSAQRDFVCGARCVDFQEAVTHTPGRTVSGSGAWTLGLGNSDTSVCFMSNARSWRTGNELCNVVHTNNAFRMVARSGNGNFRCGSMCFQVANTYMAASHHWEQRAVGNQVSLALQYGATRSGSRTVTSTWGSAFTATITTPGFAVFGGVSIASTISASTSNAIQTAASVSYGVTVTENCPHRPGHFVALFQYIVEARDRVGVDQVATALTRCHYSPSPTVPVPQCPFFACGRLDTNPLCERSKCDPWTTR